MVAGNRKLTSRVLPGELNKEAGSLSNLSSKIMKTFLLLALSFTTALAQVANAARAEDQDQLKHPKKQQQAPSNRPTAVVPTPKFQQNTNVRPPAPIYRAPQINPVNTNPAPKVRSFPAQDTVRANRPNLNPAPMPRIRPNPSIVMPPQTTTTVQPNINPRNRVDRNDRNRNDSNWRNRSSNNNSWYEARRRHQRHHHDRNWWRSHFTRFALFCGGYYFWDGGYWYPAYGYHPRYNTYIYDEPIYGYNDLDPAQVISNVQAELQRLGYYRYAVDGQMGPATRAALADYQRDNGLSITAAIDEPTLASLGLG